MILADRFVLLHFPRTGSTFLRQAIEAIYGRRGGSFREHLVPIDRTLSALRETRRSPHGCVAQIPEAQSRLPVLSVTRHPLDRIVSQYEHGFWRQHIPGDPREVEARFPTFPELDFAEYLRFRQEIALPDVMKGEPLRANVGPDTIHFLRFYFREPEVALARMTDATIDSGELIRGMAEIRFLRHEQLVADLEEFLREIGFLPEQTKFLRSMPRVNKAASRRGRPWTDYFTADQEQACRMQERLLFQRFPQYDDRSDV